MRILFLSNSSFLPQSFGGSESSTHQLCRILMEHGHEAAVLCGLITWKKPWLSNRIKSKLLGEIAPKDTLLGHPTYRTWDLDKAIPEILEEYKPQCVITMKARSMIPYANALAELSIPTIVYVRDVPNDNDQEIFKHPFIRFIANSNFTKNRLQEKHEIDSTTIPPYVDIDRYATMSSKEFVLFVGPVELKGRDLAIQIAKQCPEIPFKFLVSWKLSSNELKKLAALLNGVPNVQLMQPITDMKKVYSKTRVVLMPSLVEETWGRVATEAHASGIPVLASNRGGLPESVGPGGITLDLDTAVNDWTKVLRKLWSDANFYASFQSAALKYSKRKEITKEHIYSKLINTIKEHVASCNQHKKSGK